MLEWIALGRGPRVSNAEFLTALHSHMRVTRVKS